MRLIALLRGINLGATHRVPMAELRELLTSAGHERVRTLDQSGNVVLTSTADPDSLAADLAGSISDRFGFAVPVVVRTRDELAAVLELDPLGAVAAEPKLYQVSFLAGPLPESVLATLEAADLAPERVAVHGREVYGWHPDGIQRSPLAGMLTERRLGVQVTARNWRTLTKLLALADRPD
jgi:uncharacterized protein (DUF1697 family)